MSIRSKQMIDKACASSTPALPAGIASMPERSANKPGKQGGQHGF